MTPAALLRRVAAHLEAAELRVRKTPLRDYDVAAIRLHLDAAQEKLAGVAELLARRSVPRIA
jgi:hypothetical protein